MLVGGAMVNALAFSGSNYLFSIVRSSDVNEERKRHDQAVKELQAAQAMREFSRVTGTKLDPLGLSPSCQTSTCRAVAKETVRSPLLYWDRDRPGGLQTR